MEYINEFSFLQFIIDLSFSLPLCRVLIDVFIHVFSLQVSENEPFLQNGSKPVLTIDSMRDAVHVFVNGELIGKSSIQILLLVHQFYLEI